MILILIRILITEKNFAEQNQIYWISLIYKTQLFDIKFQNDILISIKVQKLLSIIGRRYNILTKNNVSSTNSIKTYSWLEY